MKVDCEREDCRIILRGQSTTLLGWSKVYDKHGNLISKDPNRTTTQYQCTICGKEWVEKT